MGYGSQRFATGAEFDEWIGEKDRVDKWSEAIALGKVTVLTCNFTAGQSVSINEFDEWLDEIDWGDGTVNNSLSHTYSKAGTYEIKLLCNTIGTAAFSDWKSLTRVVIGNSVTSICNNVFLNCSSLKSVEIPNSVTSIDEYAFRGCVSLFHVTIGNSLASIGHYAFEQIAYDGDKTCEFTLNTKTPPTLGESVFGSERKGHKILVPYDSLSDYKNDEAWKAAEDRGLIKLDAVAHASAVQGLNGTLTIPTSNWSDNAYSVEVEDMGENDAIFFTPLTREDKTALEEANVFISTEGNVVTFTCDDMPSTAINLKYFICRGA
jgi:hypothetical protein